MTPDELDALDHDDLKAMAICVVDDLLRLSAAVLESADSGARADAESLRHTWAWTEGANSYSDGTVIVASTTTRHIYAPPGRREGMDRNT